MPKRPLKKCNNFNCKELISKGTYCALHQSKNRKYYEQFRDSAKDRGYDSTWAKCRRMYIRQYPMCEVPECNSIAEEVHHVIPIDARPDLRLVESNLMSMCLKHHNETKH